MAEEVKQLVQTVANLVETIKGMPGVQGPIAVNVQPPQPPSAADVRAEKVQSLAVCMRKSN